ncbi:hypothetical protein cypCar_00036424 [Cyprinus carpio]|nr:hypothetical protein cypCar_00036424 [Cyprinus carpio]
MDHPLTIVFFGNSAAVQFQHDNFLLGEIQPNIENVAIPRTVPLQLNKSGCRVSVISLIGLHETALDLDSLTDQLVNENEIIAFIFFVRLGQLTDADKMGLEWLQRVFGDRVLQFVMILFTYESQEESDSIIDDLKKDSTLEQLLKKCGGRFHTCSKKMNNQSEMSDLMNRIENLFTDNKQQSYTSEMYNTALREREDLQNRTSQSGHRLTIILFGNSAAVQYQHNNILLGEIQPNIENVAISMTVPSQMKISGHCVSVINLIGLHETALDLDSLTDQLVNENEIIAFIFVVRLGQLTDADKMGLEWLQRVFGDRVLQFVMILFTYESQEESDSIIDDLKKNIEKCGGRYHTCSKNMNNQSEMRDLMNRIENLFTDNKQQSYTSEMYTAKDLQNRTCRSGKNTDLV